MNVLPSPRQYLPESIGPRAAIVELTRIAQAPKPSRSPRNGKGQAIGFPKNVQIFVRLDRHKCCPTKTLYHKFLKSLLRYFFTSLFQGGGDGGTHIRRSFNAADAGGGHRGVLVLCGALAAADDGAGVAHTAARRRGLASDEADDGLLHVCFDPFRGAFFGAAADFADQNDGMRVPIVVEETDSVQKRSADDGIAADADARGLAKSAAAPK